METKRYTFDEVCDIAPVAQFGGVDLRALAENGAIPAALATSPAEYNGIDEPGAVLGRPRDPFDEIAMRKSAKAYKPADAPAGED